MRGINKVILVGSVGQDPEVKRLSSGDAVCNLSIATNEEWKDKASGEKKSKTEWHRVVLFGKIAEIAGEYVRKGTSVYLEGKLQTREWEKDGVKRYTTEIVVDSMRGVMQLLGGKPEGQQATPKPAQAQKPVPKPQSFDDLDESIPF